MKVVIVGAGLAGLTAAYHLKKAGADVLVLEQENTVGGLVRSSFEDGLTFDWGANGFLSHAPDTTKLIEDLHLESELVVASETAKNRYLWHQNVLVALPSSPPAFLRTKLLSPLEKIRALFEWFVPRKKTRNPESVFDFVARRFGHGVAKRFVPAFVTGVTSGDARVTSVNALFPRLSALEQKEGSLLRGLFKAQRSGSQSSARLTSFRVGGIGRLTNALGQVLGSSIQTNVRVQSLKVQSRGFVLQTNTGQIQADRIVLACPAFVSAQILEAEKPVLANLLREIQYASVKVFGLAFQKKDVPNDLNGFGFLVPREQNIRILGCLYTSTLFPQQSTDDLVYLRVICGGTLDPDFTHLTQQAALEIILKDLEQTLGIRAAPVQIQEKTWLQSIPQYDLLHESRLKSVQQHLEQIPHLLLTGNAYRGVGINDVIRDATRVAQTMLERSQA